jgi:hypothetical protein
MGRKTTAAGQIVIDRLKSFSQKELASLNKTELARSLKKEYPKEFRGYTVETARSLIRLHSGNGGDSLRKYAKVQVNYTAKILILDIETLPIEAYTWGIWQQNIGINQIKKDWTLLSWSAKWIFDSKVYSAILTSKEAKQRNDKRITKAIWGLIDEADIVIAHNAKKFDIKKINSKFIEHSLPPPSFYDVIDTLPHLRKQFGFTSNKLDYVNKILGLDRKNESGDFTLWEECVRGEQKALDRMIKYNINDVVILEETYLRIRNWIRPHPNVGLHVDDNICACPTCGSEHLTETGKHYTTQVNQYIELRCDECGSLSRSRKSATSLKKRTKLIISNAK